MNPLPEEPADRVFGRPVRAKGNPADKMILQPSLVNAVLAKVAEVYGIEVADIRSRDRHATVAEARQVAMTLLVNRGASYTGVGRAIHPRDHGTIIHARRKVGLLVETDRRTKLKWDLLKHLGDPDIPVNPRIKYSVSITATVEVLAEGVLGRDEVEARALTRLFEGRSPARMVGYESEKL